MCMYGACVCVWCVKCVCCVYVVHMCGVHLCDVCMYMHGVFGTYVWFVCGMCMCVWFVCVACVYARVTCVLKHSGCRIRFGSGACGLLGFVAVDSEPGPASVCGTWWKSPPGACAHPVEWLRESL